jgi:parallel beta-helix repeat protein
MKALRFVNRFRSGLSKTRTRPRPRPRGHSSRRPGLRALEVLESRELLATFTVTSLQGAGAGSLRQAIQSANQQPGLDIIAFQVDGTIRVGKTSLPAITGPVTIDGTTAPSYAGKPLVTVNFQQTKGLQFQAGADGSTLKALSLVNASNSGVTLSASHVTLQGNYIGVAANGSTVMANRGDGVRVNASSQGDLIGQVDPVTSVTYYNSNSVSMTVSGWQGIRDSGTPGQYLITGTSGSNGLLYIGPISGAGGTSYPVNVPGSSSTSVYGPDVVGGNVLRLVGSYRTSANDVVHGFVFQGTLADLANPSDYQRIDYPTKDYNYIHSTAGDLAVGNAGDIPVQTDKAFLYSVSQGRILTDIVYPGSQTTSTSAYGIWYNGGTSYTICGGYTTLASAGKTIAQGYLVDYDSATGQFTHWTSFAGPNGLVGSSATTHFQGISSPVQGIYTLAADEVAPGSTTPFQAELATVRRNPDGTFSPAYWVNLNYPGATGLQTNDAVAGNQLVGIVNAGSGIIAYQATVNLQFQLSNVISGNRGNGIALYGASDNRIAMNNIGTDATGTLKRGNAKNGIFITQGASGNMIGGDVTGGNDPTAGVIVRPPQGNLISGNRGDGVLINRGATRNTLSGNFVGTAATGNSALGNTHDGVAIDGASGNKLIGCKVQDDPFVYYNVLSGNGGNGLRITNSNNTTVQANFLGAGASNTTIVPNHGDGLLVSGTSANTQVGGIIPLGNVISGNMQNGIEATGKVSGLVSFNTFGGTFAFGAPAPNRRDGILITATGGNNLIRTCIISGNLGNGIEIGGKATGVQVTDTTLGLEVGTPSSSSTGSTTTVIPNRGDGILILGQAHDNAIGGYQPSIEPQNTIASNGRYGIEVLDSAHNNDIFHTYIGTGYLGTEDLGNTLGGVYLGAGTAATTIGGTSPLLRNKILNSTAGHGITIRSSSNNVVLDNDIRGNQGGIALTASRHNIIGSPTAGNAITDNGDYGVYVTGKVTGTQVQGNAITTSGSDGVMLVQAQSLMLGGNATDAGNPIVHNQGFGLYALGVCTGTVAQANTIVANGQGNVNLTNSKGITYIPG